MLKPDVLHSQMSDITLILQAVARGEEKSSEEFFTLVYEVLRRLAAPRMAGESAGQTPKADGEEVAIVTVSVTHAQDGLVPDEVDKIHFELEGPGKILGVGNGDPSSHEPDVFLPAGNSLPDWQRCLFSSLAQIIVQSTKEPGEIKLIVRADGLTPVTLTVPSQPAVPRPAIDAR